MHKFFLLHDVIHGLPVTKKRVVHLCVSVAIFTAPPKLATNQSNRSPSIPLFPISASPTSPASLLRRLFNSPISASPASPASLLPRLFNYPDMDDHRIRTVRRKLVPHVPTDIDTVYTNDVHVVTETLDMYEGLQRGNPQIHGS